MDLQPDADPAALPLGTGTAELEVAAPPPHRTGRSDAVRASGAGPRTPAFPRLRRLARRHSVLLACLATLLAHLLWLSRQLGTDEGGFAMVATHWREGGPFLYGPQWVDRPPGLILMFDAARHLGPYGVRLTATLLAVALVAAIASAAETVGGRPAARWAAWTAFALASSVLLGAQRLNGELAAATFVAVSVAALLRALRGSTVQLQTLLYGALAGVAAAVAVLLKQNFVDGFLFAAVLLTVGLAARTNRPTYRPDKVAAAAIGFAISAVLPIAATLSWATGHGGVGALAYAVFGFRADAATVMATASWSAPLQRLRILVLAGCVSGLVVLLVHLALSHRRRLRRPDPLAWAVLATAGAEAAGVIAGANFWNHYLIALIPMAALTAGLSINPRTPGWQWTRRLILVSVVTTAIVSPVVAIRSWSVSGEAYTTGRWLAASSKRGDTLVVPLSHSNVIEAAQLEPAYPYSWSLPARTLDPHLSLLQETLDGPSAPAWVVRWNSPHAWGLDPGDHVDAALRRHYQIVAEVCGHSVWLHDGLSRQLAPTPPRSSCGRSGQ